MALAVFGACSVPLPNGGLDVDCFAIGGYIRMLFVLRVRFNV